MQRRTHSLLFTVFAPALVLCEPDKWGDIHRAKKALRLCCFYGQESCGLYAKVLLTSVSVSTHAHVNSRGREHFCCNSTPNKASQPPSMDEGDSERKGVTS